MFYKHILNSLNYSNPQLTTYRSTTPSHHKHKYYKELKDLVSSGVLTEISEVTRHWDKQTLEFFVLGALYSVNDISKLETLALHEDAYIPEKFQQGKLISILNEYNQQPYVDGFSRMKFNKGRANNVLSYATTEKQEHLDKKSDRFKYLNSLFGYNNWIHYDVPSSIPQVIHLLNKGFWLNQRVWDLLGDANIKPLGQRIMFNTTEYGLARSIFQFDKGNSKCSPSKTRMMNCDAGRVSEYYYYMSTAVNYSNMLQNIIGPFPGKTREERGKIFIHESNIYLLVLQKFMKAGVKVVEVYDSFYWDRSSGITVQQVENWVKECAEYYYNNRSNLFIQEMQMANNNAEIRRSTIAHQKYMKCKNAEYYKKRRTAEGKSYEKIKQYIHRNADKAKAGIFPKKWTEAEVEIASRLLTNTLNNKAASNNIHYTYYSCIEFIHLGLFRAMTFHNRHNVVNKQLTALPSRPGIARTSLGAEK